jgi:hypothetical protein
MLPGAAPIGCVMPRSWHQTAMRHPSAVAADQHDAYSIQHTASSGRLGDGCRIEIVPARSGAHLKNT